VKLLFDQNISPKILKSIAASFPGSSHVRFCSLEDSGDSEIYGYARKREYVIVTFDTDFIDLSVVKGSPPKIIVIRTGNLTTKAISNLFRKNVDTINEFLREDDLSLLEIHAGV